VAPLAERFVRIRADTRGFAADLRKGTSGPAIAKMGAAAGADWSKGFLKAAQLHLDKATLSVKVKPDWSGFKTAPSGPSVKAPTSKDGPARAPARVPVELDPLVAAFQADLRKQLAALSKQVSAKVPVSPETSGLREDLADKLRTLERQLKVKVPAGADARKFETELRALAKEVESQVRVHLPVEADGAAPAARKAVAEASAATRGAKIPVELNPLVAQFQANVRRELAGLQRLAVQIPVNPNTDGLRRDVALRIAAIERTLKIKVPVESDGKGVVGSLTGQLGGLKGVLGSALGVAPQGLQALTGGFDAVSGSATRAAGSAGQLGSSLSGLGGPIGTALGVGAVAIAISALPAVALAATGAIFALGGALASLPAFGVGLGAVVGTLGLGFAGLSDRFKQTAKAGGGAAKSMSGVRSAQRAVTQAQRELLKATKDLDKARKDEIERIDDLGRSLRGSRLDEEDAAAGVAAARTALAEARASGDVNAIGEADRAYRRSLLTLDEARDKTGDLAAEQDKASKVGVEGSDQVQEALDRQRNAAEQLKAAQESLADAQKSLGAGGGAAAKKLMAIAPAAQEVVDKIKALKPAFDDLRLSVQQRLFQGVAAELQRLADVWLPQLKTTLGDYAGTINEVFLNLGSSVREPAFVRNIAAAADNARINFAKISDAVAGPLVEAFGRLAVSAAPFVNVLGDKVAGLVTHFSDWIKSADESGKLDRSSCRGRRPLPRTRSGTIGGNVVGIFG
jgi:hypothetical protein